MLMCYKTFVALGVFCIGTDAMSDCEDMHVSDTEEEAWDTQRLDAQGFVSAHVVIRKIYALGEIHVSTKYGHTIVSRHRGLSV